MARYLSVKNNVSGLGTGAIYYDLPSPQPEVWVTINVKPINIYAGTLSSNGGLIDFLNLPYTSYPDIEFDPKTLIGWSSVDNESEPEPHQFVAGIGEDFFAPWWNLAIVDGGEVEDNIRVTISYGVTYQSREPFDGGYLLDVWEMHLYVNGVDQGTVEGQIEVDVGGPTESANIQSVSIFPSGLDWTDPAGEWRFYSIKIGTTGPGSSNIVDDDYENGDAFPGGWGIQYPTESEGPEDQFVEIIDDGIPEDPDPTDSDGDGWSDEDEIAHGTDPFDPNDFPTDPDLDSDDDGYTDEEEVDAGTDPFDPDSFPGSDTPPLSGTTSTVCRTEDVPIVAGTTDYEVVVSGQAVLSSVGVSLQVSVFLEADDIGDLKIMIISPAGTTVVLTDHNGSPHTSLGVGTASESMAIFDPNDASVTLDNWPDEDNIFGLVIPLNSFDAFAGEDPNGIWIFRVITVSTVQWLAGDVGPLTASLGTPMIGITASGDVDYVTTPDADVVIFDIRPCLDFSSKVLYGKGNATLDEYVYAVSNIDGSDEQIVLPNASVAGEHFVCWHPNNTHIFFTRPDDPDPGVESLFRINIDGTGETLILSNTQGSFWDGSAAVSPDGTTLVAVRFTPVGSITDLVTVNLSTLSVTVIWANFTSSGQVFEIRYVANGTKIAADIAIGVDEGIYLMDTDGGNRELLTPNYPGPPTLGDNFENADDICDDFILAGSSEVGGYVTYDAITGDRTIIKVGYADSPLVISPDGSQIAYIEGTALHVMNSDGTGDHIVMDNDFEPSSLDWVIGSGSGESPPPITPPPPDTEGTIIWDGYPFTI